MTAATDRRIFAGTLIVLALAIVAFGRANLIADPVDYYINLQRLIGGADKPLVSNAHFAAQRSPGYSLAALVPYALLSYLVDPFVTTKRVAADLPPVPPLFPVLPGMFVPLGPPGPPGTQGPGGPGPAPIPPRPLLLHEVPFKDFEVPFEGSFVRWRLLLALALASGAFLFAGLAACAKALDLVYEGRVARSLVSLMVVGSPMLVLNVIVTPLYATLAAFGSSALFVLFLVKGYAGGRARDLALAGFFLGLLVLTRLETGVLAFALVSLLVLGKRCRQAALLLLGTAWALPAWMLGNLRMFGTPVHLGILRGDINKVAFDPRYIADCLFHPHSGILVFSPLCSFGIVGLLLSRRPPLPALGLSCVALLCVYLVRVPIMFWHVGEPPFGIGGLPIASPPTHAAMLGLVRSDMNRYVTALAPLALLGLPEIATRLRSMTSRRTTALLRSGSRAA